MKRFNCESSPTKIHKRFNINFTREHCKRHEITEYRYFRNVNIEHKLFFVNDTHENTHDVHTFSSFTYTSSQDSVQ